MEYGLNIAMTISSVDAVPVKVKLKVKSPKISLETLIDHWLT